MASFRTLLASAGPVVVLDAASSLVQVGLLRADGSARWADNAEESNRAVFEGFERLAIAPAEVGAWVYCDGPGSILGIRTVAMALRTWQVLHPRPILGYCSLAVVARAGGAPDVRVIADARRDTWHCYQRETGLRRVAAGELAPPLVTPENFRHWSALPPGTTTVPYALADLLPRIWDEDLLQPTDQPDAFLHEEPSYVTWTPGIHRAPLR
jgi:tRNA threonylcarbamoyladenosine biosynthesis protein TsaB